jgi:hypothetical protein
MKIGFEYSRNVVVGILRLSKVDADQNLSECERERGVSNKKNLPRAYLSKSR